jgi:flagellar biosynthesis component FlhA
MLRRRCRKLPVSLPVLLLHMRFHKLPVFPPVLLLHTLFRMLQIRSALCPLSIQ